MMSYRLQMTTAPNLNSMMIRSYIQASQQIDIQIEVERNTKIKITAKRTMKNPDKIKPEKQGDSTDSIRKIDAHKITWKQICLRFELNEDRIFTDGLTTAEATARNLKEGDYFLSQKTQVSWYWKLLSPRVGLSLLTLALGW